jgi:hypothetical protein
MRTGVHQFNINELAIMAEDDLNRALRRGQEQLGRMRKEGASAGLRHFAETEVCYLLREAEIRDRRRQAHTRWLRDRPDHFDASPRHRGRRE